MKNVKRIAILAATLAVLPSPAFAYIDPAVGSMLFQGIVGAIAVAGTAWYTLRQKITDLFKGAKPATSGNDSDAK
jgi:hypothetical protein